MAWHREKACQYDKGDTKKVQKQPLEFWKAPQTTDYQHIFKICVSGTPIKFGFLRLFWSICWDFAIIPHAPCRYPEPLSPPPGADNYYFDKLISTHLKRFQAQRSYLYSYCTLYWSLFCHSIVIHIKSLTPFFDSILTLCLNQCPATLLTDNWTVISHNQINLKICGIDVESPSFPIFCFS